MQGRGGVRARLSAKGVQYVAEVLTGALLTEVVTSQAPAAAPQELRVSAGNDDVIRTLRQPTPT